MLLICLQVHYDSETKKIAYVSPPPSTELEFADIINGKADNSYIMPEYVTSFLLGCNITLQFSDLDSKTVSRAMQLIVSKSLRASGIIEGIPFSLGEQTDLRFGRKSVTAHRTANGMIIHIPAAQVIGYYTRVVPQFPKQQN